MKNYFLFVTISLIAMSLLSACDSRTEISIETTWPEITGIGEAATADEIAIWNIDVSPDGTGLPVGSGTANQGAAIYALKCAACHGLTGTEGPFDKLVGRTPRQGFPFSQSNKMWALKTIGNYWPYATTIYDYLGRAMPTNAPGSLLPDEIYALTAFLLYKNEIIAENDVMDATSLPLVKMPAGQRFVRDDRRGGAEVR